MRAVSIGEIQKNISILTNLTESIDVIDGRKKEHIAIITPVRQSISVKELGAKYRERIPSKLYGVSTQEAFEATMTEYAREKYENSAH